MILVFDFDGVISNSVHDSFRTAVNTYRAFRQGHRLPVDRALESAEDTFRFEQEHPEVFDAFNRLLPLGNHAKDYCVILTALDRNEAGRIQDQEDFDAFKQSVPADEQNAYYRLFYEIREALQKKDIEEWARLLPIFPGVAEALRILKDRCILAIATSKDRISVDVQLEKYGIADCFQPENILDKEAGESKRNHLTRLRERHGVPFHSLHFIDDKVLHLVSVKSLGVQGYLALWGFNTPREHTVAKKEGFRLLRLEDLPRIIQ